MGGIWRRIKPEVHLRASSECCRCHVIEISFNYFLLGGETGPSKADTVIRDQMIRCLGSPSITGRWWGHYNRIGHAGTTLNGGHQHPQLLTPASPPQQSRNKVTKEEEEASTARCWPPPRPPAAQIIPTILPGFIHAHLATGDQPF